MGTRSLTHIKGDGRNSATIMTVYRQFDGYPTGMGADIQKALGGKKVVNGYSDPANQVNGMGCAAATLVSEIKDGCGNVYIYAPDTSDCWEEYTYTLWNDGGDIFMECVAGHGVIYSGKLDDFDAKKVEATEAA